MNFGGFLTPKLIGFMSQSHLSSYITNEKEIKEVLLMKIAVVGKMRSGKNTVADILTDIYGYEQLAFADGIREIINKYFPEAYVDGKPRKHYQHIGQSLRKLNHDVWVNHLYERVLAISAQGLLNGTEAKIVVTDCRQKNEELFLRKKGFKIIKVISDDELRIDRMIKTGEAVTPEQFNHDTEMQVDKIEADYIITNNGTYEELDQSVVEAYRYFLEQGDIQ